MAHEATHVEHTAPYSDRAPADPVSRLRGWRRRGRSGLAASTTTDDAAAASGTAEGTTPRSRPAHDEVAELAPTGPHAGEDPVTGDAVVFAAAEPAVSAAGTTEPDTGRRRRLLGKHTAPAEPGRGVADTAPPEQETDSEERYGDTYVLGRADESLSGAAVSELGPAHRVSDTELDDDQATLDAYVLAATEQALELREQAPETPRRRLRRRRQDPEPSPQVTPIDPSLLPAEIRDPEVEERRRRAVQRAAERLDAAAASAAQEQGRAEAAAQARAEAERAAEASAKAAERAAVDRTSAEQAAAERAEAARLAAEERLAAEAAAARQAAAEREASAARAEAERTAAEQAAQAERAARDAAEAAAARLRAEQQAAALADQARLAAAERATAEAEAARRAEEAGAAAAARVAAEQSAAEQAELVRRIAEERAAAEQAAVEQTRAAAAAEAAATAERHAAQAAAEARRTAEEQAATEARVAAERASADRAAQAERAAAERLENERQAALEAARAATAAQERAAAERAAARQAAEAGEAAAERVVAERAAAERAAEAEQLARTRLEAEREAAALAARAVEVARQRLAAEQEAADRAAIDRAHHDIETTQARAEDARWASAGPVETPASVEVTAVPEDPKAAGEPVAVAGPVQTAPVDDAVREPAAGQVDSPVESQPPPPQDDPPAGRPAASRPSAPAPEPVDVGRSRSGVSFAWPLLLVMPLLTLAAGALAWSERSTLTVGVTAALAVATYVLFGAQRNANVAVTIEQGVLRVRGRETNHQFDLARPGLRVEVDGSPGDRRWQVRIHRTGLSPFVIDTSMVDPVAFEKELRRHCRPR